MRFLSVIMALVITLLGTSCTCQQKTKVRIGINPWPGYELLWLAHEKGLYKAHGIEEEMIEYASLVDAQTAMSRGHLDILCSTVIEVLLLAATSRSETPPAKVILVPDFSNGADVIISRNGMKGMDLRGKKIALEQGSLGEFMLKRFLDKNNMTKADITPVGMDQSKVEPSMISGAVDAAITYPPISINLAKHPDMKIIFTSADIPGEVIDSISASQKILAADPALPKKIRAVWVSALQYYKDHPEESIAIMARHERTTPEEFKEALTGMTLVSADDQNQYFGADGKLVTILESVQTSLINGGTITKPVEVKSLIP
jgi:NitT/TauT family transport system substrate-binding protein